MKKSTLCLFGFFMLTAACDEKVPRSYFATDGITIGDPAWQANGHVTVPIQFNSETIHSAQWIRNVDAKVIKKSIVVTAKITKPPKLVETDYPGSISLSDPAAGDYEIVYRDPDGTDHALGTITIPQKP